jgi:hypothetical protein
MAQEEFAFKKSINRSTEKIAFEIVYGRHPRGVAELRELKQDEFRSGGAEDFATEMQRLNDQVRR